MLRHLARLRALALPFLFLSLLQAQTFRGEIRGQVTDASGAAIAEAEVRAVNKATGFVRSTVSSASGDFSMAELPLGEYEVTVKKTGFGEQKATSVEVQVSRVTTANFQLQVSQQATVVEVSSAAVAIETTSTAITSVVGPKTIEDLPINGRDFRQMFRLVPGAGPGTSPSVNGNRTRGNNFQIDGADNNDGFQNVSAVNQGGVSGIAGTLLPVEALDQFAIQTTGSAEVGRNPGANVNLVLKSGTNNLHGSMFYVNRNEAFAERSAFQAPGTRPRRVRNHQGGFSVGGPIIKSKMFFFLAGEMQDAQAAVAQPTTTPSDAWVNRATQILTAYGVPVNPVSRNLLSFWPTRSRVGGAVANNYQLNDSNLYDSYNGVVKIDYQVNDRNLLSGRYYAGTGRQVALVGNNPGFEYFQSVPSRMHNVAITLNSTLSPRIVNNLTLGANYFLQTFQDADTSFDPIAAGLNTGVDQSRAPGSPNINIAGFSVVGQTQPLGRIDTTGHLVNTTSWMLDKHQIKFGGEYRVAVLDIFYQANVRGTLNFDGTRGPWAAGSTNPVPAGLGTLNALDRALSDFMAGYLRTAAGATITRGDQQRDYRQNSFDLYFHDTYQVNPKLSVNFGVRYAYTEPLRDKDKSISTFVPGRGIVGPGFGLDTLYPKDWNNIAPRVGFAYQPFAKTVIRGGWGIYYDVPAVAFFASNNGGNGGASGVNGNPGGPEPIFNLSTGGGTIQQGVPVFGGTTPRPPYGAFGVDQNFRTPFTQNFNFNIQRELWNGGRLQVAYVGSQGRKLVLTRPANQPLPLVNGASTIQARRPFATLHPDLAVINILESTGNSGFNSFQLEYTQNMWKGFTAQIAYTYGKTLDYGSEPRNAVYANQFNRQLEFGPAAFDVRHLTTAFFTYDLPVLTSALPKQLVGGWRFTTQISAHTGQPLDLRSGTDRSGTGNLADRVDVVGNPYGSVPTGVRYSSYGWFDPRAFTAAAPGTFGNIGRNALYGPGFGSVDVGILKEFGFRELAKLELRAEIFNIMDRVNFANPNTTFTSGNFGLITATRNGSSAPGLGFGEPRNVQFTARIRF